MPIVEEFKPQITLVSAGFDGADGHANQLGGYKISPAGFGFMTKQQMSVCDNKVVLVLEGKLPLRVAALRKLGGRGYRITIFDQITMGTLRDVLFQLFF